jgi:hypothetical protein
MCEENFLLPTLERVCESLDVPMGGRDSGGGGGGVCSFIDLRTNG